MRSPSPKRPQTMGQVLQSFASALEDERKRGLPRFNREQVARIQKVVKHLADPQAQDLESPQTPAPQRAEAARTTHQEAPTKTTARAEQTPYAPQKAQAPSARTTSSEPAHPHSSANERPRPAIEAATVTRTQPEARLPWMIDESEPVAPPASRAPRAADRTSAIPSTAAAPRDKSTALAALSQELADCQRCGLCNTRTHVIFGEGNPNARLMLIGEAPSRADDQSGHIFSDEAGELLTNMLQAMTLRRQDVYCTNILKCHPPNHRAAAREELATCAPFLRQQIEIIKPEVILTLGSQATRLLLGARFPFAQNRGEWNTWENIDVMPTWHPSYLLQHPREKASAWQDLQKVMQKLGLS